jgi:phenylalanyl-tRNA synthetase alpha chain
MTDNQFTSNFEDLNTVSACLELRDQLSDSGIILELKNQLPTADKESKILLGKQLNELKQNLKTSCDSRIQAIQLELEKDSFVSFDPTFHGSSYINKISKNSGSLHPITIAMNDIVQIFQKTGFCVADGPLVETQDYCFSKLCMPDYHPARSMQDTFYLAQKDGIGENYVLRTHTSSIQIRHGQNHKPPIRIIAPGQVYRNEKIDATHDIMFHQIECLYIDERVSFAHLRTLIEEFYKEFFRRDDLVARLRPSYFPYVNPGLEVDISNPFKENSWLEVGGAGLVHPEVIENLGLDPDVYQGLAFGFGIDRMAQLRYNLRSLGQFFNGDLEFIEGVRV